MELSACDGDGGLLGMLAVSASSVQGVLVHLGDGGVLGVLSDSLVSVEPLLVDVLPLLSLEPISLVSSLVSVVDEESGRLSDVPSLVSVVDEESGRLSDVPLSTATLLSAFEPVSGTCHDPPVALQSPCVSLSLVLESTDLLGKHQRMVAVVMGFIALVV